MKLLRIASQVLEFPLTRFILNVFPAVRLNGRAIGNAQAHAIFSAPIHEEDLLPTGGLFALKQWDEAHAVGIDLADTR